MWGAIRPTKPIIPAEETAAPVAMLAPATSSDRNKTRFNPKDCDATSPRRYASKGRDKLQIKTKPTREINDVDVIDGQSLLANEPINQAKMTTTFSSFQNINSDTIELIILLSATPASNKESEPERILRAPMAITTATTSNDPSNAAIADVRNPNMVACQPITIAIVTPRAAPLDAPMM